MISHKHKCIFIHISKCAGSSIESAFGIDISNNSETNNVNLFGWNNNLKIHLQHATPQEIIKNSLINQDVWKEYYKFIVVRNPWDRAYSDYIWLNREQNIADDFKNFIDKKGKYKEILTKRNNLFRGDHLTPQKDYFIMNNSLVSYDRILRFESLYSDLRKVEIDLNLKRGFFDVKVNRNIQKFDHYSLFYDQTRKNIISKKYKEDIDFLNYHFTDEKSFKDRLRSIFTPSYNLI